MYSLKGNEKSPHEKLFDTHQNALQFRTVESNQIDGVRLTEHEKEYLLPHFLLLLVGKPGSGKTTMLKQLLTNPQMYYRKFDHVYIVSPSHAKMDLKVKPENCRTGFSLDWIFSKIDEINAKQHETVFGTKNQHTSKGQFSITGKKESGSTFLGDKSSRFHVGDMFKSHPSANQSTNKTVSDKELTETHEQKELQTKYAALKELPRKKQEDTHKNVLLVLDDVVGAIKKAEFDHRLSQLVMNRRHLIFNGTLSIIMVTQKYTLIPSRVRSNASWLILYQLNPNDFETAYNDVVTMPASKWKDVLHFTFNIDLHSKSRADQEEEKKCRQEEMCRPKPTHTLEGEPIPATTIDSELRDKKFENLGIWVESNMYFKNFKRIKL